MADKDVDGVIAALATSASLADATVIATSLDMKRALPASELAARWRARRAGPLIVEADPLAALDRALDRSGPVVVAGSLYLVGAARGQLIDDPELRDPEPNEDA
jgi:folylpolyglutamate synthase/dihydropteroate synthase